MDKGKARDSNKVVEIGKMMSDEEVGPREPLPGQDQGFGLQRDGNQGGHLIYVEPIKDVRFTLHDGPQQEQMFWGTVCGPRYRYNPKDKITETPVGQAHGGGEVFWTSEPPGMIGK